jgi:hypothetical protein
VSIIVAKIEKSSREHIRITLDEFRGRNTIDVRIWYADGDAWKPSKSGVTTSITNLVSLADGMQRAVDRARAMGLVSE